MTDSALVARVLIRDTHAFETLFERYADALQRHASHIVHDEAAANEEVDPLVDVESRLLVGLAV